MTLSAIDTDGRPVTIHSYASDSQEGLSLFVSIRSKGGRRLLVNSLIRLTATEAKVLCSGLEQPTT